MSFGRSTCGKASFPSADRDWLPEGHRWGLRDGEQSRMGVTECQGEFQCSFDLFLRLEMERKYMPFIPPMLKPPALRI